MTSTSDASAALLFDDIIVVGSGSGGATTTVSSAASGGAGISLSEHSSAMTTRVIVHPLVLLHVLDHHTRRQEESGRVIGTLLGRRDGNGTVEVTNCFAVPHAERGDEVAIGKDFNKRMLSLYLRSNRRETVVGWYASTAAAAASAADTSSSSPNAVVHSTDLVTDTSSLIHEFYAGECGSSGTGDGSGGHGHGGGDDPVHLVVDTRLVTDQISIRAYKSTPIIVQGEALGNLFHELRLDLQSTEPETICVHEMMALEKTQQQQQQLANITNGNTINSDAAAAANSKDPSVALRVSIEKLYTLLEQTLAYVDSVVDNKNTSADPEVGRQLADALASVPRIRPQVFDALFRESLQDLLMVTYLSNVTRTQLTIAEKLNASLGV
jgi:translation initiation factor 3 subunit F